MGASTGLILGLAEDQNWGKNSRRNSETSKKEKVVILRAFGLFAFALGIITKFSNNCTEKKEHMKKYWQQCESAWMNFLIPT